MYHRIAVAAADPWGLAVPPTLFEQQLAWLKQWRLVLPLREFGRLHSSGRLPANAVGITFDDGYACNALMAAPLLRKYDLPATMFLATGYISSPEEFWWDALERIIQRTNSERLSISLGEGPSEFRLGPPDSFSASSKWRATTTPASKRQAVYLNLWEKLRATSDEKRRQAIADLHHQTHIPTAARPSYRVMTASEVAGLVETNLIDIGAHSVTHPVLYKLSSFEQKLEIEGSREACFELVGRSPNAFAYPYGAYDQNVVDHVAACGFDIGCTTEAYGAGSNSRILTMPRLAVGAWNGSQLADALRLVRRL